MSHNKDAAAIRKHCHNHSHTADTSCFSLAGNAAKKISPEIEGIPPNFKNKTIAQRS